MPSSLWGTQTLYATQAGKPLTISWSCPAFLSYAFEHAVAAWWALLLHVLHMFTSPSMLMLYISYYISAIIELIVSYRLKNREHPIHISVFSEFWLLNMGNRYKIILFKKVSVAQLCPTLCNPMDCSPPGSSVHGILQARILEWVAMPSSRGSSQPRDGTHVS